MDSSSRCRLQPHAHAVLISRVKPAVGRCQLSVCTGPGATRLLTDSHQTGSGESKRAPRSENEWMNGEKRSVVHAADDGDDDAAILKPPQKGHLSEIDIS